MARSGREAPNHRFAAAIRNQLKSVICSYIVEVFWSEADTRAAHPLLSGHCEEDDQ